VSILICLYSRLTILVRIDSSSLKSDRLYTESLPHTEALLTASFCPKTC